MEDTVFTRIIKREIPANILYENARTIVLLDINPVRTGHVIVVSKNPVPTVIDLPDEDYYAMWQTVKKVSLHLRDILAADRVAIKVVGIDVPHAHIHLIPFSDDQEPIKDDASPVLAPRDLDDLAERLKLV